MTGRTLHIWQQPVKTYNNEAELSAILEGDGFSRRTLWFRVPESFSAQLSESSDPFVIATIFLAMRCGGRVHVHGQVSSSLLENLEEFMAAWRSWRPERYNEVSLHADAEQEPAKGAPTDRAISMFSGGVDSCFTAFRHANSICGRRTQNLQTSLMVHGFDIPIDEGRAFAVAFERSKRITDSVDIKLVPVATNFRAVVDLPWRDVFGAGLASCLHVFAKAYDVAIIPSSYTYRTATFPYGSNAITDPLLSSASLRILYDGAETKRFEKIRQLLDWPEATENLRVCWQGDQKDRNCGQCEKCIRNILAFRALEFGLPGCFDQDISDEQIYSLRVSGSALDALRSVGVEVDKTGSREPWVKALNSAIRRNQRAALYGDIAGRIAGRFRGVRTR
ncbi:MAG: hypothetical protein AAGC91_03275 [Pseudomonadota bacterium]